MRARERASKFAGAASATDRERAGEGKGEERSRLARNSCNLMGFFDWYLMPVAIGPIHTPFTYPKGIHKNRALCPRRNLGVIDVSRFFSHPCTFPDSKNRMKIRESGARMKDYDGYGLLVVRFDMSSYTY